MRGSIIAVMAIAGLALSPAAHGVPKPTAPAPTKAVLTAPAPVVTGAHGSVFLLRGLVNVFSLGMDTLGRKIRAKDIPVRVTNFTNWHGYAAVLVDLYRGDKSLAPVVIIGHSLGADAAVDMANHLAQNGVPVRLVVAFDGVHDGHTVGKGIDEVINYYKADGVGKKIEAAPGFTGTLTNVDLSDRKDIDHLNIEKSPALHAEVVARLVAIFGNAGN